MSKSFPNTGAITGTNADRLALSGVFEGMQFFETDTNKMFVYDGSSWVEISDLDNTNAFPAAASDLNNFFGAWTSYTPVLTNITLGTGGSTSGKYLKIGKLVLFYGSFTLGSSGFSVGDTYISVPVTAVDRNSYNVTASAINVGISPYSLFIPHHDCNTTQIRLLIENPSAYGAAVLSNTVPFSWGSGDKLYWSGSYEAA